MVRHGFIFKEQIGIVIPRCGLIMATFFDSTVFDEQLTDSPSIGKGGTAMSQSWNKLWSLIAATVLASLVMSFFSAPAIADSNTPGGEGYTAPAPTKRDLSGSDQDQYYIPQDSFPCSSHFVGGYRVNGDGVFQGWHSTNGASSVTVTTDCDSGTWTFDFSSEVTGVEAANRYSVVVDDECSYRGGPSRKVKIFAENVDDSTDLSIYRIESIVLGANGSGASHSTDAYNIQDGQIGVLNLVEIGLVGLSPQRYSVKLKQWGGPGTGNPYLVKELHFSVPTCRTDSNSNGEATGTLKPQGLKVKAFVDARGVSQASRVDAKVIKRQKRWGKKVRVNKRDFSVKAGTKRHITMRTSPWFNKVVYALKVRDANNKWRPLDRIVVRPRRR